VSLWIAGEGNARTALEGLIDELNCRSFVRLLGHVADPKLLYQAMDLFVLSSVREGLPNSVLEAMALETPVVATRVAGVPIVVRHGASGVLVSPANLPALTTAIDSLIDDAPLRRRLAIEGRATVESQFSFARRMEKVASVYDEVLAAACQKQSLAAGDQG
jgi:glycosyltransferase involved in cell wall biosynthesis